MATKKSAGQFIDPATATKAELLAYVKDPARTAAELEAALERFPEVDRAVARREDTAAALLEKLAHSSDKATREAVAGHLNVPPQVLVNLGRQFPKAFLENPALDIILIENPALLKECEQALLVQIAKRPECPESYLRWAAGKGDEKVQLAVAMNPQASAAILEQLAQSPSIKVREALAAHRSLSEQAVPEDLEACFRQAVAERIEALTIPEAHQLWKKGELGLSQFALLPLHVRKYLAGQSTLEADSLCRLHPEAGPFLASRSAQELAEDPATPPAVLKVLAQFAVAEVRFAVAKNPATPVDVLESLASDAVDSVRRRVAWNEFTPASLLAVLAKDVNNRVRSSVAENTSTPSTVLALLARSADRFVRAMVTNNPSTPVEVLQVLAKHTDPRTSTGAQDRLQDPGSERKRRDAEYSSAPDVLEILAQDADIWVRRKAAANPNTPAPVLASLAQDTEKEVRRCVVANPNTPLMILEAQATDADSHVRLSVATNPNTPTATQMMLLEKLAKDSDEDVRLSVARHFATPAPLRNVLLDSLARNAGEYVRRCVAEDPNTPTESLEFLAQDGGLEIRRSVAKNPNTPSEALVLLIKDPDGDVRLKVAKHPNTPPEILMLLAKGPNGDEIPPLQKSYYVSERDVLDAVASNPSTPMDVLAGMARDGGWKRSRNVAENPAASVAIREIARLSINASLAEFSYGELCSLATEETGLAQETALELVLELPSKHDTRASEVAGNPDAPVALLHKLARDKSITVRRSVARNPNLPMAALDQLSKDKSAGVRLAAIFSVNMPRERVLEILNDPDMAKQIPKLFLPADILEALSQSKHESVHNAALSNSNHPQWQDSLKHAPKTNPWFIEQLGKAPKEVQDAVEQDNILFFGGKDPNKTVLTQRRIGVILALADGVRVAPERIARVSKSTDWLVRMAVARNRGAPPNILQRMMKDTHHLVAAQAELTRRVLNGEGQTSFVGDFDRQKLSEELASLIRNRSVIKISPLDPAWGSSCPLDSVWVPNLTELLQQKWGNSEWVAMGDWLLAADQKRLREQFARQQHNAPAAVLEVLAKSPEPSDRLKVALNPNTPALLRNSLMEVIAAGRNSEMRARLATGKPDYCDGISEVPASILEVLAADKESNVRREVAKNPNTPAILLEVLAKDNETWVRSNVAENSNTPVSLLEVLAKDNETWVRSNVAENPNTTASLLEVLANDNETGVRHAVAKNPNTPEPLRQSLQSVLEQERAASREEQANSEDPWTRKNVAGDRETPIHLLEKLAMDTNSDVRQAVAENPATPVAVLANLAKDSEQWYGQRIREKVAKNPNTPAAILEVLAQDESDDVRISVARNGKTPTAGLALLVKDKKVGWAVASNSGASAAMLEVLAKSRDPYVRRGVAGNPNTPATVLPKLAKDEDPSVRQCVSKNPNTPADVLETLARKSAPLIALEEVLSEPGYSGPAYPDLVRRAIQPPVPPQHATDADILRALIGLGYLPEEPTNKELTTASRAKDWLVRLAVCLHPAATEAQLKLLAADSDANVAAAARQALAARV